MLSSQHKKYTIGIDARMYGPQQTGIGTYIQHLTDHIFVKDTTNQYVMFMREPEYSQYSPPRNVTKVKVQSPWYSWREQCQLPFELKRERVDLMHFPHFNAPIFYPGKMVVTIHDLTPRFFPGHKMGSPLRRFGFTMVFSRTLKNASKVIAVSRATKNDILRYHKIPEDKIEVIYEGVKTFQEISNSKPAPHRDEVSGAGFLISELKEKYHITKPFIFYVGVWRNHKNLVGLLRAFEILREKYRKDIALVLGGEEDPHYPEVRRTWEELGLTKEIIRPGFLSDRDLPLFYKGAALFVIPSLSEGFGFVGLEAARFGTPVAASYIPALREVLGNAAVYFNPHDPANIAEKVNCILSSRRLRETLMRRGLERQERYSWDSAADRTIGVYRGVLNVL